MIGAGREEEEEKTEERDRGSRNQIAMDESAPETYARLAAIKARYDPDNLFRLNPNIARE